jgi:diguanylate cyclase (GGDEF)-like protein
MLAVEPLPAILAVATAALVVLAALLAAALTGRGPLYGRFLVIDQQPPLTDDLAAPPESDPVDGAIPPTIRLLTRARRPETPGEALARHGTRSSDEELDEVLRGSFAADTYNRAVRVLAWSFILAVLVIVSVSQLWQPVQPQIFVTLALAGGFILVVHELMPPGGLGTLHVILEGSAAIVFLTMLVLLTGNSSSPFFFLYPLLVGGVALMASPLITLLLTVMAAVAYAVAAFSGPLDGTTARETLARVGINLTALMLLAYAGMVISRVQARTRDTAIRLSTVDSLTDLYNRAFLFNSVDREINRSRRFRRGFCLLMMDLDGLKAVNDRYGHYRGDMVLRGLAQIIRTGLRDVDVAARYGGDEFVALLPETDPSGAYVVAEKIRQGVSELMVEGDGQRIMASLSIGVVSYPDDGQTADELMIAADEAMYLSKGLGGNRVVGYADPGDMPAPAVAQTYRPAVSTPGFRPLSREGQMFGDRRERRQRREGREGREGRIGA